MPADEPPDRRLRAALSHLHDLPYLQTHPFGGRRGKELRRRLADGLAEMGAGRTAESLRLRYAEGEAMTAEEAIDYALADDEPVRLVRPTASPGAEATPRSRGGR